MAGVSSTRARIDEPASLAGPGDGASLELRFKLLPGGLFALFSLTLIVFICLSWLASGLHMALYSALAQVVITMFVLLCAVSLKVNFSRNGIVANSNLHRNSLHGRGARDWEDVHSIRLRRVLSPETIIDRLGVNAAEEKGGTLSRLLGSFGKNWMSQGFIVFDFRSGGYMPLPIAGIPDSKLEEFFLNLAQFADPVALSEDVLALQRDVLMGQTVRLETSYTRMWEESLKERFEVTNFVPLPGGKELRDGELQVLMQLASGGMSSVYLARLRSGRRVILKELVVPPDRTGEARTKIEEMFDREARILAQLDHPQIVAVRDHFVERGRSYLVLDLARGLTLRQFAQLHGPVSEPEAIAIGRQLAEIAVYLHGFDPPVIHRDITPDNIVFDDSTGLVKLIDFGAATELVEHLTGTLIGKQSYIPVEQFRGHAVPASDIYAIGATLHFILTGEDPIPLTVSHPRQCAASVSVDLDAAVARATTIEVADRIARAEQLFDILSAL